MAFPDDMPHRLERFLGAQDPRLADVRVSGFEPIVGGMSRAMARFRASYEGRSLELILRADPPAGTAILESDRATEWALMSHLHAAGAVSIPRPRWFDGQGMILGTPAIIMDAVDGTSLVATSRSRNGEAQRQLALRLADLAADLVGVPCESLPTALPRPASWERYMDDQISQWSILERANPGSDPFMRYVGAWLDTNRPPPAPLTLVHGDLQIANVLVGSDDHCTLIDWELAHIGDPREDLGWYRLVGALTPPDLIGLDEAAFCTRYCERTGLSAEIVNPVTIAYFTILGSLKVFSGILGQAATMTRGDVGSTAIAYTILVQSSVHRVWMGALGVLDAAGSTS